jgi:hypothetical protein
MTRKDYEVLARSLGVAWAISEALGDDAVLFGVSHAVDQVGLALSADNARFSVAMFEAAVFASRDAELTRQGEWSGR